jgi:hypothetical protein
MAAFACTATDCVYRMMARGSACRDDVRMAFSQFIVSSAAFDYICDDAPELFPELAARITEDRLRRALTDPNGAPDISRPGSPLVAYVSALFDDQVALWWRIAARSDPSGGLRLPAVLTAMVVDLFRAEIRSRPADSPTPDPDDSRAVIWRDPLWMACQLVAATSDVDPSADLDDIRRRTESAGRLFALIDDVVDFEHDWRTGSRNRLIDAVRETAASPQNTPPSEAALSEEVVGPYMKEITTLVAELSDPSLRDDVGGWLHSWLEP